MCLLEEESHDLSDVLNIFVAIDLVFTSGVCIWHADPTMERRVLRNFYIPRDENFDGVKQSDFLVDQLTSAAHNLVPAIQQLLSGGNNEFRNFKEVRNLYEDGLHLAKQLQQVKDTKDQTQKMDPFQVVKNLGADDRQDVLKFTIPQVISCEFFSLLKLPSTTVFSFLFFPL